MLLAVDYVGRRVCYFVSRLPSVSRLRLVSLVWEMQRAMLRFYRWSKGGLGVFVLGLVVLAMVAGSALAEPVVKRVSFTPRSDGQGYVVRIHTTERLHAFSEPRFVTRTQLELVLFNAQLARNLKRDTPGGPVQAYTVEARQGHLILRFQLDARTVVTADVYRDRATDDMLLGLTYASGPRASTPTRPVASGSAPALDDARARWRLDTVVIDAGHGGHDSGAIGAGGLREKDVVLPVALKVGEYLEELLDLNVVYTRRDDRFVTLRNRGTIANEAGGKLFISIHANAARNRTGHGTETYFLGMHKTDAAQSVMERENSVIQYESDPNAYAGLNQTALIEQTLAQSAYMRSSELLAGLVQQQFSQRVGRVDRGVKQAGFYVLWGASMPAILVELGFVTNADEAAYLRSENGQIYLASAIYRAVREFKTQYEKGLDLSINQ